MNISEIFYSIQGESTFVGKPCIFIRTQGCNLKCKYCDTKYSLNPKQGIEMSIENIKRKISCFPTKLIEITGGEPLLQMDECINLIEGLDHEYIILIETNGSIDISRISYTSGVHIIMDIKCPSSGMEKFNNYKNIERLNKEYDELKFVIQDDKDFEFMEKILKRHPYNGTTLIAPVINNKGQLKTTNIEKLANKILQTSSELYYGNLRLQFPLHKYIWGNKRKR